MSTSYFFTDHPTSIKPASSLTTPPQSNLPLQPSLLPRPTTTISPTPLPNILPLLDTALKPFPQNRGGSKGSFCIDSKTFSFSFDGGRADFYAIHESHWNIKSSVWLSRKGLKWILSCFADICDWVPGKDFLCKRYRENNKFFIFRGRSNKAGIFVDIAVFYGGARRGCVMVLASSNQSRWCLFTKELDSFLSGSNTVWVEGRTSDEAVGGGLINGGGQNGKKFFKTGNQWKFRNFENSRAILGHNVLKGETVVIVSNINGRPTREFMFKLTTDDLALRVPKSNGGKLVRESVVGESSRLLMESTVVSVMPKALTGVKSSLSSPDQAPELLASNPVALHPDREGEIITPRTTVESRHPGYLEFVGSGSNSAQGPQWEDSNHFSLLSTLDREGDPWSEVEVEDVFTESHPEVNDGGASQTGMLSSSVELVDRLQNGGVGASASSIGAKWSGI
nr:hypothetical protein CFP56_26831 [Quercus suber]